MLRWRNVLMAGLILWAARPGMAGDAGLDLTFPVDFPKFTGFEATIQVNGDPCDIVVRLAPDERGKYGCIPGGCTVDGVPVLASGSLKPRLGAGGEILYFYSAALKSAPEASEKVSIKVTGELTGGTADFKYSGPKGKASLTGHPVDLLVDLGLSIGSVSLAPEVLAPGKLGGTGRLAVGLGNDTDDPGPLKASIKPTAIAISLKVGARKMGFKGTLQDGKWVGTLTVAAKPVRLGMPYSIPAEGLLGPPAGPGGRCKESSSDAHNGDRLFSVSLVNDARTNGGTVEFIRTPAGNLFAAFSLGYREDFFLGDKNCLTIDLAPKTAGPWFCLKVDIYDLDTNSFKEDFGTICFEVTETFPFIRGRYVLVDKSGKQVDAGDLIVDEPVCGHPSGGPVLEATLESEEQALGGFSLHRTTGGAVTMEVSVLLGEQFIQSTIFCLDIDPSPRSKGAWFCVPVEVAVPGTPDKVPFGEACLTVTGTFPYLEGGWSIRDLSGKVAASGTWKSQVPACGSNTGVAALHATFPDENLGSLGDLTLYPTTGGMAAVEANLFAGDQQYSVSHPCVDIDLARSAPGLWFTVEASVWDPMSSVYKPAGALEIRLQAASPKRRGSWTLRGLAGGVLGSGDWEAFE